MTRPAQAAPARARYSPEEWAIRVDLAACYRLAALNRWDDSIATHISARLPGEEAFLLNPYGLFFEEVTASNLVKIDLAGNVIEDTPYSVNPAGFVVHSAVHEVRHDAGCVMHLHTDDGVAVSCLNEGLMPLNQTAILLAGQMAYHEFEGVALDLGERERIAADLGQRDMMILRNHGTLTVGRTVAEAYLRMYLVERSCTAQVRTLSMGRPLRPVEQDAIDRSAPVGASLGGAVADLAWAASLRRLDRLFPDYSS